MLTGPPDVPGPRVSVALATFEGERFLSEQLESLARQTLLPHELVVGDDGSTDGTLAILEGFAARAPFPVHIYPNAGHRGFAENFLHTAGRCRGELVAFCDQDDVWGERKLERCAAAFAPDDVALAIHAGRIVDERLGDTGARFPEIGSSHLAPPLTTEPWMRVRGMCMVFARPLLAVDWSRRPRSHYLPDAMLNHDEWVYVLARVRGSIAFIADPLALYRQHGSNEIGAPRRDLLARLREVPRAGWAYYDMRRGQMDDCASLFAGLARAEEDSRLRERYAAGGRSYRALTSALERRLTIYSQDASARVRVGALLRLASESAYRPRTRGGFGSTAFLKDAVAAWQNWSG